jgi:hypothetical protein
MSYEGPGRYRHYKGGTYVVLGVAEDELTHSFREVIYRSESAEHEARRAGRGADFICRPLNAIDGADAFNEPAGRFTKIDGEVKADD